MRATYPFSISSFIWGLKKYMARIQAINLLNVQFFSSNLKSLHFQYYPQFYSRTPHGMFFAQCDRPSFLPTQNEGQNYSTVRFDF
jgi:hypothetical protein